MDPNLSESESQPIAPYLLKTFDITHAEEAMHILYTTFRDAGNLPEISDELRGQFQRISIVCLKLVEHIKHLNSETARINEALVKLDGIVTEIEKKEQENGN